MTEAYKVSVELELEDKATSELEGIIGVLDKANKALEELGSGLGKLSPKGKSLAAELDDAAKAATALGNNAGLKETVSSFGKLAVATAAIATNMKAAQLAGERLRGPISHFSPKDRNRWRTPAEESQSGPTSSEAHGTPGAGAFAETAMSEMGGGRAAALEIAMKMAAAGGEEVKEAYKRNVELEQVNQAIVQALKVNIPASLRDKVLEHFQKQEFISAERYGFLTNAEVTPFADARLEVAKEFGGLSIKKQDEMTKTVVPFAAFAVKQAGMKFAEGAELFSKFAEAAGTQDADEAARQFLSAATAAHATGVPVNKVIEGAGFSDKAWDASHENSGHYLLLAATMQKEGISGSESGYFLDTIADHPLPNKLSGNSPADKARIKAGNELGLYHGDQAQFYEHGKIDFMRLVSIIAEAKNNPKIKKDEFAAKMTVLLGSKDDAGNDVASFFDRRSKSSLQELREMPDTKLDPTFINGYLDPISTQEKLLNAKVLKNLAEMNSTKDAREPANYILDKATGVAESTLAFTKRHPNELKEILHTRNISVPLRDLFTDWRNSRKDARASSAHEKVSEATAAAVKKATDNATGGFWFASHFGKKPNSATPLLQGSSLPPPPIPLKQMESAAPEKKTKMQEILDNANRDIEKAANINVSVFVDGKEIASHMVTSNSTGASGFNTAATRPTPGTSAYGMGK